MNFEEHAAKPLLRAVGIPTPDGEVASDAAAAATIAERLGGAVVKAQVPTGKRGKAGGIAVVDTAAQAKTEAARILGMQIGGHTVSKLLVEEKAGIEKEFYAAILNDAGTKGPLVMFSDQGGMDIEEIAATQPDKLQQAAIDVRVGFDTAQADGLLQPFAATLDESTRGKLSDILVRLYTAYADNDAELLEINPLAQLDDGRVVALDCKFVLDDSAIKRQAELAPNGTPDPLSGRELAAEELDLKYIDLDGDIGVLANGAGLTMTTMDVISHHGGEPANFLEIGGEAYTKATDALKLMLGNEQIKSLVVNFCGAFARTDVMTEGVINAWEELQPDIPVFFSIHGTGSVQAREMLSSRLGMQAYETMDDAIIAAIAAARGTGGQS